jgi:hypothetical protein
MPASPEIHVEVREDVVRKLMLEHGVHKMPSFRIHQRMKTDGADYVTQAEYDAGSLCVHLYVFSDRAARTETERLRYVQMRLNEHVLHELRHHIQFQTWTAEKLRLGFEGPYYKQPAEVDARDFADSYKSTVHTIRVRRSVGKSNTGFAKLGSAQRGARR